LKTSFCTRVRALEKSPNKKGNNNHQNSHRDKKPNPFGFVLLLPLLFPLEVERCFHIIIDSAIVGKIFASGMVDRDFAELLVKKNRVFFRLLDSEINSHYIVITVHDNMVRLLAVKKAKFVSIAVMAGYAPGLLCHRDT
ncbi:MAG: hypothetical protein ACI94D_001887, partial [Neolewinella sp.]